MGLLSYTVKRLKRFDKDRFNKHIEIIAKENNKSILYVKFNWLINLMLYGVSYTDYFRGNYINLTRKEKKTFVTAKSFYKMLKKLNKKQGKEYLSDKVKFDNMFKEFLGRDFIDIRSASIEEFSNFLKGKTKVFAKIVDGFGGHGVEKVTIDSSIIDCSKVYDKLTIEGQYLVEDSIIQCDELNEVNPYSVCSFRVVTLLNNDQVYIVGNALRVNQGKDAVVGCTDDLYFTLDEDGRVASNVIDDYANVYAEHPLTHKKFSELRVPYVREALEMCKKAALKLPTVRYIGWDVAITNNGPCLIEGNEYPGYGIIQFYKLTNSRTGHKKAIQDVLGKKI